MGQNLNNLHIVKIVTINIYDTREDVWPSRTTLNVKEKV